MDRIRHRQYKDGGNEVIAKIQQLRYRLQAESYIPSTVLLIGLDEERPMTILEGNHRFAAAMLVSPLTVGTRFSVLCGLSPRMKECCWYHTSLSTLWRYARHRLANLYDPESDVRRLMPKKKAENPALSDALTGHNTGGPQS